MVLSHLAQPGTQPASHQQTVALLWQKQQQVGRSRMAQAGVWRWWGRFLTPLPPFQIWQGIDIETKMHIRFLNMETMALCH